MTCDCPGRLVETHRQDNEDGTRDVWFRWVVEHVEGCNQSPTARG